MTDDRWRIAEGNSPGVPAFSSLGPWSAKHTPQGSAFYLPSAIFHPLSTICPRPAPAGLTPFACGPSRLHSVPIAAATSGSAFQIFRFFFFSTRPFPQVSGLSFQLSAFALGFASRYLPAGHLVCTRFRSPRRPPILDQLAPRQRHDSIPKRSGFRPAMEHHTTPELPPPRHRITESAQPGGIG